MIRPMREEGAWWMAAMCWAVGWMAACRFAWAPMMLASGAAGALVAVEAVRSARKCWTHDRLRSRKRLLLAGLALAAAVPWLLFALGRFPEAPEFLALILLPVLYSVVLIAGRERHPAARVGGIAAITTLAPLSHASAAGRFSGEGWALWLALGGYFLLGSLFVMARFRRSRASLWLVRVTAPLAAASFLMVAGRGVVHGIGAAAFLILAARAWAFDPSAPGVPPREAGRAELKYSLLSCLLLLAAMLAR
jgi:hypothetical protein